MVIFYDDCIFLHCLFFYSVVAPVLSADASTATSISISWTSAGSEIVSYEVMWRTDDIGRCTSGSSDMDSTTITDGSTSYDIMGLEEDSSYTITVTASNSAGSSEVSNIVTEMTLEAGERYCKPRKNNVPLIITNLTSAVKSLKFVDVNAQCCAHAQIFHAFSWVLCVSCSLAAWSNPVLAVSKAPNAERGSSTKVTNKEVLCELEL